MAGLTSDSRQRRAAGEYFEGRIRVRPATRIRGWPREDGLGEDGLEEGGLGRMVSGRVVWRRMVSELGGPEPFRFCRGRFGPGVGEPVPPFSRFVDRWTPTVDGRQRPSHAPVSVGSLLARLLSHSAAQPPHCQPQTTRPFLGRSVSFGKPYRSTDWCVRHRRRGRPVSRHPTAEYRIDGQAEPPRPARPDVCEPSASVATRPPPERRHSGHSWRATETRRYQSVLNHRPAAANSPDWRGIPRPGRLGAVSLHREPCSSAQRPSTPPSRDGGPLPATHRRRGSHTSRSRTG